MKYQLTKEVMEHDGRKLYRIEYEDGTKGGWLEFTSNLSQEGNCKILDEAKVFGSAKVWENAQIRGEAMVFGFSKVYGKARISDSAIVCDHAQIYDRAAVQSKAFVHGYANVFENARVFGKASVGGKARVYGNAMVSDEETTFLDLNWSNDGKFLTVNERKIRAIPSVDGEETIRSRLVVKEKAVITLECTNRH